MSEKNPKYNCTYSDDGQCASKKRGETLDAQRCNACMLATWLDFTRDVILHMESEKEYSKTLRAIREKYTRIARKSIRSFIENGFESEHWKQILELMEQIEEE